MSLPTTTPDCVYLTKPNIQHPGSAAQATAAEVAARVELNQRLGLTVTGGSIKQGR
ncbi:MAG: hypothetical protein ACXVGB_00605 [Mycobacteriaceae bacterium]